MASIRSATITEWPPKWFLKLSAADRPLRCMVLFWLFFVSALVLSEEFDYEHEYRPPRRTEH
ncbi:MAG: hypothetical protein DWH99_11945 [Planctomycetota bacterium]|nr:MAG: hypothetical protein DWH99_11945 [Planctomycetota bacterium]